MYKIRQSPRSQQNCSFGVKQMISKTDIKNLIDGTENRYQECWDTLSVLKQAENLASEEFRNAMLDFQPTLARTLYELSEMYKALHQEKRSTIDKKGRLSPKWFKHRLALIAGYQRVIETVLSLGKCLGDAFAWLFYDEERKYLTEHYNHQEQLYAPPGIGGLGELKFIENHRIINGHLVLYHGITTFLRIGDISLIDIGNQSVAAIGELKTTQVSENELNITVQMVGPSREGVTSFASVEKKRKVTDDNSLPPDLPQNIRAKLDKQTSSMGESFSLPDPDLGMDLESEFQLHELNALCKELKRSAFTFRKVGDGHLIFGMRIARRSLASKLMGSYKTNWTEKLDGLEEEVQHIIRKESDDNELWLNPLYSSERGLSPTVGTVPLFWWPLDLDVIKAILFNGVLLFSAYSVSHND